MALILDRSPTSNEVHDDRNDGEDEEQMDKEAAHVKDEKSSQPKHYQDNTEDEKHRKTCFLSER